MSVEVLIPWRAGCPHRQRTLDWVLARYAHVHPAWTVTVATAPDGEWCKAAAVMPAARRSTAEIVIVADADVWCDQLPDAVLALYIGHEWAVPHDIVHRLDEAATALLVATGEVDLAATVERLYRGVLGGGIVALPRQTLLEIPLDHRFKGWGQEDVSWALALTSLVGLPYRGTAPLIHLWHPPQPRFSRKVGNEAGKELHRRYITAARAGADAMRQLLEEVAAP